MSKRQADEMAGHRLPGTHGTREVWQSAIRSQPWRFSCASTATPVAVAGTFGKGGQLTLMSAEEGAVGSSLLPFAAIAGAAGVAGSFLVAGHPPASGLVLVTTLLGFSMLFAAGTS